MRVLDHPILGPLNTDEKIQIIFNGKSYPALKGESIAAALMANHVKTLRFSEQRQEPRGIYCGIGHCYECRVTVNEVQSVRACITPVKDQMKIESQGRNHHEN